MHKSRYLLFIICLFLTAKASAEFTPPELTENLNSSQPKKTANMSRLETWTFLSFIIDENGEPKHIEVIDKSHSGKSERGAIRYVENLRYTPATFNGKAVPSADTMLFSTDKNFKWSGNDGISVGVQASYGEADTFMQTGDMSGAKESLDELEDRAKNLTEQALSASLHAAYYLQQQEWAAYGNALERGYHLIGASPEQIKLHTIQSLLKWYMVKKQYSDADYVLYTLKEQSNGRMSEQDYEASRAQVMQHLHNNPVNEIDVTLLDNAVWSHRIPRSRISLTVKNGDISFAELRCENGHITFDSFPVSNFDIPTEFFECQVLVKGDANTQMTFKEQGDLRDY